MKVIFLSDLVGYANEYSLETGRVVQEHIDRLKVDTIDWAGGSVAVAKSSQLHEEKGSGAPCDVIRQPGGGRGEGARQGGNEGPGAGRGVRGARAPAPRAAPLGTRLPSVASRLCLCLCESRRSVHRTRAPNTTRAALLWPRTRPLPYRRIVCL
ncbi:unnamed protein product [Colias eurytheme]|nr:unnamed protein product [Colias eurytheme]